MDRVAVVAPADRLPDVLAALRDAGAVQVERVAPEAPLEAAGEAAVRRGAVAALVGWSPRRAVAELRPRLAPFGGAVVRLAPPAGVDPPTLVGAGRVTGAFQPLVDTYATVPYADLNPAVFSGLAYIVMFGMMFGDVGHGALVVAGGVLLATGRPRGLARLRRLAPFVIGAGAAAMGFGVAYGEAFGPTHLVPALWLEPLDHPTTLLAAGVAGGAGLLAVAYALGTANRWREGGLAQALVATSGMAGVLVYLGVAVVGLGWYEHLTPALVAGGLLTIGGLTFGFAGCYARAGSAAQAAIELFDAVLRIGTNTVSFARLAAFGLTHAALGEVVWSGTTALWHRGGPLLVVAAAVFVGGTAVSVALEGLVAGVQALRLEYYELFSRIFVTEGRPFRPWGAAPAAPPVPPRPAAAAPPPDVPEEESCSRG